MNIIQMENCSNHSLLQLLYVPFQDLYITSNKNDCMEQKLVVKYYSIIPSGAYYKEGDKTIGYSAPPQFTKDERTLSKPEFFEAFEHWGEMIEVKSSADFKKIEASEELLSFIENKQDEFFMLYKLFDDSSEDNLVASYLQKRKKS